MRKSRILVVDDEPQITRVLRSSLTAHGYDVRAAADADSAFDTFGDFHPDLIITDLQMPQTDGIELCRRIRQISQVPIIILSVKGEEKTKVEAFDSGADDYVTKPFGMDELLARVRATLRRLPTENAEKKKTNFEIGDFSVDLNIHRIFVRGKELHLTPKEFELLVFLVENHSKVLTHQSILRAVWGANSVEQTEYLRVFLGNLRKKVEVNPAEPQYILTEPWIGYRFTPGN